MDSFTKINSYIAEYYDPRTGTKGRFQIKAFNERSADIQARDGFFGLLAPPSDERRAELQVKILTF